MDCPNRLRSKITYQFTSLRAVIERIKENPPCSDFWKLDREACCLLHALKENIERLNRAAEINRREEPRGNMYREVELHRRRLERLNLQLYNNVEAYTLQRGGVVLPNDERYVEVWIAILILIVIIFIFIFYIYNIKNN